MPDATGPPSDSILGRCDPVGQTLAHSAKVQRLDDLLRYFERIRLGSLAKVQSLVLGAEVSIQTRLRRMTGLW
ncbi:hypothetical protein FUT69_07075 [Xylella taiwanensis]|uniref:Uncharacterized protein n=1 Tax=Xylella taiwanensis TaxID=1444770 RepID=A0ABS8TWE7_9GAMM|nr:hypothetical protein [Xylella taiwanensis]MCD8460088.1 hypothetical protein [Xylella taiwanensis]MCD8472877.1 hypothetical protein [Xylella taiwanensis]NBI36933.1 hypothetical protein [Xylella taiwanensis]UFN05817.1 hypothetical protein LPH42_06005 [Xylella taiwanensis]UFN22743.1 hypothetical protein LPH48_00455 [Xylella taiwanensis]